MKMDMSLEFSALDTKLILSILTENQISLLSPLQNLSEKGGESPLELYLLHCEVLKVI